MVGTLQLHNMKEGPGGWWALLGDDVEKRVPKVDKSMVVKGEKNVMHPTSANPAFLKIFECLLEMCHSQICLSWGLQHLCTSYGLPDMF